MKLVVLGATSGVGKELAAQASAMGHGVTAVGRSLKAGTAKNVTFITGDATDAALLERIVRGADVIVIAIGLRKLKQETFTMSDAAKNVIAAMYKNGVKRVIVLSAGAATVESNDSLFNRRVLKPMLWHFLTYLYKDTLRMEKVISTSNTDWTLLRLSRLTNGKHKGGYRTAYNSSVPHGMSISRADVADYIVKHLSDTKDYKQHISIAY